MEDEVKLRYSLTLNSQFLGLRSSTVGWEITEIVACDRNCLTLCTGSHSENSKCNYPAPTCVDPEVSLDHPTVLEAVGITNQSIGQTGSGILDLWDLFSQRSDTSLNTFQVDETQSQADKDSQVAENCFNTINFEDSQPLTSADLEDLKFLDTYLEGNEISNMDCQDINFSLEPAEESLNLASLISFNYDITSDIPVQELSYDFNSVPELTDLSFWSNPESDQISSSSQVPLLIEATSNENIHTLSPKTISISSDDYTEILSPSQSSETSCIDGQKYREMRRKNNVASQRSRKMRKQKESNLAEQLKKLEKENSELLLLAEKLEKERDCLQRYVLKVIAKK
ncbi:hypothetical protein AVEN_251410-1 [Araneus ventricosus]|uniref:BZIP domain-containing protein n=1 Tax=Araneus ventricosus TaxID=182803 RepID=A0A4Y2KZC0_ARAVE|nr:hypothetical protein AVEN_251410-1 [Araneus ventricosus]